MNEKLIEYALLLPFVLFSCGIVGYIGQTIYQFVGHEISSLDNFIFVLIGILLVVLFRDWLLKIQKALINL